MIETVVVQIQQARVPTRFQVMYKIPNTIKAFYAVLLQDKPGPDEIKWTHAIQWVPQIMVLKINL